MNRLTLLTILGVVLLLGVGCNKLISKVFEDPRYIEAQENANKAKLDAEAALATLKAAKTDEEKVAAKADLDLAQAKFASAVDSLDAIKDEAIQSPATGFVGMLTSAPGIVGTIASGILALLGGAVQLSRKNYKKALAEVSDGLEEFGNSDEGKKVKKRIAQKLESTGAGKVLDKVLGEKGLLKKSKLAS